MSGFLEQKSAQLMTTFGYLPFYNGTYSVAGPEGEVRGGSGPATAAAGQHDRLHSAKACHRPQTALCKQAF